MKLDFKSVLIGAVLSTLFLLAVGFDRQDAQPTATIYTDSTDVQYIVYRDGMGGLGITPRYRHDGSLVLGGGYGR